MTIMELILKNILNFFLGYWLNYTFEYLRIDLFKEDIIQYLKQFDDDANYLPNPGFILTVRYLMFQQH